MLFQVDRNPFPLAGMDKLFKSTFVLDKKHAYIGRAIWKIKENRCQ